MKMNDLIAQPFKLYPLEEIHSPHQNSNPKLQLLTLPWPYFNQLN